MKQYLRQWIAWLIMVCGVCLLSGPFIIGTVGEYRQQNVVQQFEETLNQTETNHISNIYKNENLIKHEPGESSVSETTTLANQEEAEKDAETQTGEPQENDQDKENQITTIDEIEKTPLEKFYDDAAEYNDSLIHKYLMGMNTRDDLEYFPVRTWNYGIKDNLIGTVTIPRLEIELGLYLGATDYNMSRGLAVFGQTSVPLGRPGENCSIAGHRGWNGTPMLRDIQQLMPDDSIYIRTLWGELEYRVCELRIVTPEDNTWCAIDENRTLITLMTCHPYGRNYQRYIVFAELHELETDNSDGAESSIITGKPEIKKKPVLMQKLESLLSALKGEDTGKDDMADIKELLALQPVTMVNADGSRETIEIDTTAISPGAEEYGTGVSNLVIMAEDKMLPIAIGAAVFVGVVGIWLMIQTVRGIHAEKKKNKRRRVKGENNASE